MHRIGLLRFGRIRSGCVRACCLAWTLRSDFGLVSLTGGLSDFPVVGKRGVQSAGPPRLVVVLFGVGVLTGLVWLRQSEKTDGGRRDRSQRRAVTRRRGKVAGRFVASVADSREGREGRGTAFLDSIGCRGGASGVQLLDDVETRRENHPDCTGGFGRRTGR